MKMRKRLKKHSLKFVALIISFFLWIYVLNSEKVQFEKTVMLDYILPEDMVFAQKPPSEVMFMIEGPRAFVRTVLEREERLVLDLNKSNLKRQLNFALEIQPSQLTLPFGMKVERVMPRKLNLKLEKKVSKILPVKVQFTGELPAKVELKNIQVTPSELEVNGPRSIVVGLKEIQTRPVDYELMIGHTSMLVEPLLPDERLILSSTKELKFSYELKAQDANFTLNDVPIKFMVKNKKLKADLKTASVKLLLPNGLQKDRSNISSSVQILAEIPPHAKGRVEIPLKVVVPAHIHVLEVVPKTIIVNVR